MVSAFWTPLYNSNISIHEWVWMCMNSTWTVFCVCNCAVCVYSGNVIVSVCVWPQIALCRALNNWASLCLSTSSAPSFLALLFLKEGCLITAEGPGNIDMYLRWKSKPCLCLGLRGRVPTGMSGCFIKCLRFEFWILWKCIRYCRLNGICSGKVSSTNAIS